MSLVHKFEGLSHRGNIDDYLVYQAKFARDFSAKGNLFVFVDECHRTHTGRLMKQWGMPDATFVASPTPLQGG